MVEQDRKAANSATTNACKLCAPLGACLAFRGIEGALPFLHGSQGCATYIRRYLISHFREPMDVAASNFNETSAIFGGTQDFVTGLRNVGLQYHPRLIGVATTCLSETIGEDMGLLMHEYRKIAAPCDPLVCMPRRRATAARTPTASLDGQGDRRATRRRQRARRPHQRLSGSRLARRSALRQRGLCRLRARLTLVPDISDPLDGPILDHYEKIPAGGTPIDRVIATVRPPRASSSDARCQSPRPRCSWRSDSTCPRTASACPSGLTKRQVPRGP